MARLFRWFSFVFLSASLAACAETQASWREDYSPSQGYYNSYPSYGHSYERERLEHRGRCSRDRYDWDDDPDAR